MLQSETCSAIPRPFGSSLSLYSQTQTSTQVAVVALARHNSAMAGVIKEWCVPIMLPRGKLVVQM